MSSKTSNQPGRRTPLSLSGAVTKGQPNKGGNATNGSGSPTSNNNKQQQKTDQQQAVINSSDTKDNPNKKQQPEKKQQTQNDTKKSGSEKTQNGVNTKQQANENKQQNKEKQQNGKDEKLNDKDKKEKLEKQDKPEKQDKSETKEETKAKDNKKDQEKSEPKKEDKKDQEKSEIKKEDKKIKEVKEDKKVKEVKEAKKEVENKKDENQEKETQSEKSFDEIKSKNQTEDKTTELKDQTGDKTTESKAEHKEEEEEKMELVQEELQKEEQKSLPATPKTNTRSSKTSTPSNKTPTKASEKTPQKMVTPNSTKITPVVTREVTTAIDADVDMEPLTVENSPIKSTQLQELAPANIAPTATSTPGKIFLPKRNTAALKTDVQLAMHTALSLERPRAFSQISGRKSIRPITEYTPSKFQSSSQFRESYRRINTELDATNTSLNVTVGSEVPNNSSFSFFFGRGRKRDRTPPQHFRSDIGELQTDIDISPPKRAKYDMHGFFSVVSSPLSLLRNRFSKASLQSSTPVKLEEKFNLAADEIEVQNISGVSEHEEINKTDKYSENATTNNKDDATLGVEAEETQAKKDEGTETNTPTKEDKLELEDKELQDISLKSEKGCGMEVTSEQSDIKITETPLQPAVGDAMAKNKRCKIM